MMVLFFPNDITKIELLLQAPKSSALAIAKGMVTFFTNLTIILQ